MWGSCRTEGIILNRFLLNADPTAKALFSVAIRVNIAADQLAPASIGTCHYVYKQQVSNWISTSCDGMNMSTYIYAYVCLEY